MSEHGIEKVRKINEEWLTELEKEKDLHGILMNEPFSDDYWKEKYKIVMCNLESNFDKQRDKKILDIDIFKEWLEKKVPTIKKTSLFIHCLYNKLHGIDIEKKQYKKIVNDNSLLLNTIKKITYMNLIKDSNVGGSSFDKGHFKRNFEIPKERQNTIDLIEALSPDILIVTSDGIGLMEQLFKKNFENHIFHHNKTLFVSRGHPSRCFNDNYIESSIELIMKNLIQK